MEVSSLADLLQKSHIPHAMVRRGKGAVSQSAQRARCGLDPAITDILGDAFLAF